LLHDAGARPGHAGGLLHAAGTVPLGPKIIEVSPEALELFKTFVNDHGQEETELDGDLSAAWSKLEGYAARFALVHFLIRGAADEPTIESRGPVDEESMAAGIALAEWFGEEAKRVYAMLDRHGGEEEGQADLGSLIRQRGGEITVRDLQQACRRYRGSADLAERDLNKLVKTGVGEWITAGSSARGGRPRRVFKLLR
jgi:hypothetical protein